MNLLIHVGTSTFFNSLFELALVLKRKNIKCVFFFDNFYFDYLKDLEILSKNEFNYFVYDNDKIIYKKREVYLDFRLYFSYYFKKILGNSISNFFSELFRIQKKYKYFRNLLISQNITHLVLSSDLVQYDTGLYLKISKKRKTKSIILPQFFANYKEAVQHIYLNSENQISSKFFLFLNKIFFLKKWTIYFKDRYLIRLPLYKILVKEIFMISPKNPWSINTGGADLIVVEGAAVKTLFMGEMNFVDNHIIVAGSINNDRLFHVIQNSLSLKNSMIRNFKLDGKKPTVLVAIPPNMHYSRSYYCEFVTYSDLINYWMSQLVYFYNYNILLTLHPSISCSERDMIFKYGYPVIDKSTVEYLPLADLFVASISATIQWAITCEVPVLNYDVYQYDYDEYKYVEGVVYSNSKSEFNKSIKFYNDLDNLNLLRVLQKNRAHEWGIIDGKFSDRFCDLLGLN
jgi:hypothetical protein